MYKEAIEAYKQAIRIKPDYAEAHNNLGAAYDDSGMYKEAIEAYNPNPDIEIIDSLYRENQRRIFIGKVSLSAKSPLENYS